MDTYGSGVGVTEKKTRAWPFLANIALGSTGFSRSGFFSNLYVIISGPM